MKEKIEDYEDEHGRKIVVLSLALFILFLSVSYFLIFSGTNYDILSGYIGSYKVVNGSITFGMYSIIFKNGTYDDLVELYKNYTGKEIKGCLLGHRDDKRFVVNSLVLPVIVNRSYGSVIAYPCPKDKTIIAFHTHPNHICLPSVQDFKTSEELNESVFEAVMCDVDRFYFYK